MSWDPACDYHTSALLARRDWGGGGGPACIAARPLTPCSAIDTVLLPARAGAAAGGLGPSMGADLDLDLICRTARGDGSAGRTAHVTCHVEAPRLARAGPSESGDRRLGGGGGGRLVGLDRGLVLHPALAHAADPGVVSEVVVLRGCRVEGTPGGWPPCPAAAAHEALALDLFPRAPRCPKRLAVVPAPLALPVTFPLRTLGGGARPGLSVLTRLGCSRSFRGVLEHQRDALGALAGSGEGQALLASWDMGREDAAALVERLEDLAEEADSS